MTQHNDSAGLQPGTNDRIVTISYRTEHDLVRAIADWALCAGWITLRECTIRSMGRIYARADLLLKEARDAQPLLVEVKREIRTLDEGREAFRQAIDYGRAYAAEHGVTPVCLVVYAKYNSEVVDAMGDIYSDDIDHMDVERLLAYLIGPESEQRMARAQIRNANLAKQLEVSSRAIRMMSSVPGSADLPAAHE